MSNLINLINQHALSAAQAGNWQAVADTLNALTTEVRDTTLRSGRWLMLQLPTVVNQQTGMTESDIVLGTLQQSTIPRVKAAYDSLVNGGIDLSEDQVQQMIPVLAAAANWPAGLADKILQAGRKDVAVLENQTTADDCQKAWNQQIVDQSYATVQNEIIAPELSSPTRTKASIAAKLRQAAAALEA